MVSNLPSAVVNSKIPILFLNEEQKPCVYDPATQKTKELEDSDWSRWHIRAKYKLINALPEAKAWYKLSDPMNLEAIPEITTKFRWYQTLGIKRMLMSNILMGLPMGSGKTLMAIAFCVLQFKKQGIKYFLIVCPPTVFVSWIDQLKEHLAPGFPAKVYIAHGAKKKKVLAQLRSEDFAGLKFIITSYETLGSIRETLKNVPLGSIFFDESSKIKNPESQRTQQAHAVCKNHPTARKFCASGTPSTTNPMGYFSQFEILAPGTSGAPNFVAFEQTYANKKTFMTIRLPHGKVFSIEADTAEAWLASRRPPGQTSTYKELGYSFSAQHGGPRQIAVLNYHKRYTGFKNLDQINLIVQRHGFCLKKEDILADLPPKTLMKRCIELSPEQRKAYDDFLNTNRSVIEGTPLRFDASGPHAKLHQIAQGYILDHSGNPIFFKSQPKLNELENIIEESEENQKIIVWSPFRPQIQQIVEFLAKKNMDCIQLHGGTPVEQRPKLVHAFTDPAGPNWCVANPAVGGLGLNLTCSNLMLFMTNWYQPDVRSQAEDRAHRLGQKNPVTIIDLETTGTIEVKILKNTLKKISIEGKILSVNDLTGDDTRG